MGRDELIVRIHCFHNGKSNIIVVNFWWTFAVVIRREKGKKKDEKI